MRKILIAALAIFTLALAGCTDKKISDNRFNVMFYVGRNSTYVNTYFDVLDGSTVEKPEDPKRPSFVFDGWYKDIQFTQPWDFDADVVTSSIVLFAKWNAGTWTLNFVLNEELNEVFVNPDNVPTEFTNDKKIYLPLASRPGGSFKGWILVPSSEYTLDMKIYRYSDELPILEYSSFTLYPVFTNNKYMITFSVGMAGVPKPAPKTGVEYGSIVNWTPKLADTDTHRFVGWFTKNGIVSGDWGVEIKDGDYWTITANALLYGKWEEK